MSEKSGSFDWKSFTQKTWVVAVSGILLPPVGIILAWLKPDWSRKTKWITTGLMGLLLVGRLNASNDKKSEEPGVISQTSGGTDSSGKVADALKGGTGLENPSDKVVAVNDAYDFKRQSGGQEESPAASGGFAELPAGLTPGGGVTVGRTFSRDELRDIAGRFIQNEIKPGWDLEKVIAVLGKPTKFARSNGFIGQTPEQQKKFLEDPLIPPSVKRQMQKELAICTWSDSKDPDSIFIMLGFQDGVLGDGDSFITLSLAK